MNTEPAFALEDRLDAITRVHARLQERLNKLSPRHGPERKQLAGKIHHATKLIRLLKADLGIGPKPTHAGTEYVGGVKIVTPVWRKPGRPYCEAE